jgi:hypothetical protein
LKFPAGLQREEKQMVQPGDLVLVYMEGKPAFFARIEDISPDLKPEWYQVKLLVLQIPLLVITWILRRTYIDGDEFTMGGRPVKVVKVISPEEVNEAVEARLQDSTETPEPPGEAIEPAKKGKVVSLMDRRKKD